jgi:integrase
MAAGIEERHSRSCRTRKGGRCDCEPTYRVRIRLQGRDPITRAFTSPAEAKGWRKDAMLALRRGRDVDQGGRKTLRTVAAEWLQAAEAGTVRARGGDAYKPSAIRSYERTLRLRVYGPDAPLAWLGDEPIEDIRRADLQELVDHLTDRIAAKTIEATVIPLKAVFRREIERDRLKVNPTVGLKLPRGEQARDRIADPVEARALLAALPDDDRAVWATAMYAGLRRGELRALRVRNIDLDANVIRVERGWDDKEGEIPTKGRRRRKVPIPAALREPLLAHLMRTGRRGDPSALVFGSTAAEPFAPKDLTRRADTAWAKLERITLHECRHTFASYMIAAGVNAKALSTFMGHASITITLDRYGHLFPGAEDEAAGLLDTYLTRTTGSQGA